MPRVRCTWVNDDPLYISYHDKEWGVPVRDDRELFELLLLEGAQAGLSWYTILKKREAYRRAGSYRPAPAITTTSGRSVWSTLTVSP